MNQIGKRRQYNQWLMNIKIHNKRIKMKELLKKVLFFSNQIRFHKMIKRVLILLIIKFINNKDKLVNKIT